MNLYGYGYKNKEGKSPRAKAKNIIRDAAILNQMSDYYYGTDNYAIENKISAALMHIRKNAPTEALRDFLYQRTLMDFLSLVGAWHIRGKKIRLCGIEEGEEELSLDDKLILLKLPQSEKKRVRILRAQGECHYRDIPTVVAVRVDEPEPLQLKVTFTLANDSVVKPSQNHIYMAGNLLNALKNKYQVWSSAENTGNWDYLTRVSDVGTAVFFVKPYLLDTFKELATTGTIYGSASDIATLKNLLPGVEINYKEVRAEGDDIDAIRMGVAMQEAVGSKVGRLVADSLGKVHVVPIMLSVLPYYDITTWPWRKEACFTDTSFVVNGVFPVKNLSRINIYGKIHITQSYYDTLDLYVTSAGFLYRQPGDEGEDFTAIPFSECKKRLTEELGVDATVLEPGTNIDKLTLGQAYSLIEDTRCGWDDDKRYYKYFSYADLRYCSRDEIGLALLANLDKKYSLTEKQKGKFVALFEKYIVKSGWVRENCQRRLKDSNFREKVMSNYGSALEGLIRNYGIQQCTAKEILNNK